MKICTTKKIFFGFLSSFFSLLILFFIPGKTFSQDTSYTKNSFFVEPIINVGKIVKNFPQFPENDFCLLNELNIGWQTSGRKSWHHAYGFPQLGISFIYTYQGNDVVLGRTLSVMPNFSVHAYRSRRHDVEFRIGSGLAYFPVIYDSIKNPTNTLIGSRITAAPSFSLSYRIILSKKLQYKFGVSTFHFSGTGIFNCPMWDLTALYSQQD